MADGRRRARSRLFSPLNAGRLRLEHRIWVPAMAPWRASPDGFVTEAVVDWYERFAAGEPGALVVEATGIRDVPSSPLLRIGDDRFLPRLAKLVEAVREPVATEPGCSFSSSISRPFESAWRARHASPGSYS